MTTGATLPLTMKDQADALREGQILGLQCGCGYQQFSPMARCPKCGGTELKRQIFSSQGTVVSYTIQSVASEQFLNETPFAFAIIKLHDGPSISGWIPWIARASDLPMGSTVQFTPSYKPGMQFEKI